MSDKGDTNPVEDTAKVTDGEQATAVEDLKAEVSKKELEITAMKPVAGEKDARIVK